MRLASWSATPWAISAASSSGVLISTMLSWTLGLPVMLGDQRAQLVGLGAAAADHDAGAGGVDVDADLVAGALDLDPADRRRLELAHDRLADLPVLGEVLLVLALAEPAALPVGGDAEAEAVGVDLLTHYLSPSSAACEAGLLKPAASACSSVSNHTSALVIAVVAALGRVVEHRVGVALDRVRVGAVAVVVGDHRAVPLAGSSSSVVAGALVVDRLGSSAVVGLVGVLRLVAGAFTSVGFGVVGDRVGVLDVRSSASSSAAGADWAALAAWARVRLRSTRARRLAAALALAPSERACTTARRCVAHAGDDDRDVAGALADAACRDHGRGRRSA